MFIWDNIFYLIRALINIPVTELEPGNEASNKNYLFENTSNTLWQIN